MDDRTRQILEASVEHWRRNVAAESPSGVGVSARDCPLCEEFLRHDCRGCPVFSRTGQIRCRGTPYERARRALLAWADAPSDMSRFADWAEAAMAELEFLESLRE